MTRKGRTEGQSGNTSITSSIVKPNSSSTRSAVPKSRRQPSEVKSLTPSEKSSASHEEISEALPADQATDPQVQLSSHDFEKIFNSAYHDFFHFNKISDSAEKAISSQDVDIEQFDRLTLRKQYQRYISLYEGRIIFHEVPNAPHGELISHLHDTVARQLDSSVFAGTSDNGMPPPLLIVILIYRSQTYSSQYKTSR